MDAHLFPASFAGIRVVAGTGSPLHIPSPGLLFLGTLLLKTGARLRTRIGTLMVLSKKQLQTFAASAYNSPNQE